MFTYSPGEQQLLRGPVESKTYTADRFTALSRQLQITQSMGRVGSCFDNAAAEAFFSSPEWEVLRDAEFRGLEHAQSRRPRMVLWVLQPRPPSQP